MVVLLTNRTRIITWHGEGAPTPQFGGAVLRACGKAVYAWDRRQRVDVIGVTCRQWDNTQRLSDLAWWTMETHTPEKGSGPW